MPHKPTDPIAYRLGSRAFKQERALADALLDLFEGVPASVMLRTTNVSAERFDEICDLILNLREER